MDQDLKESLWALASRLDRAHSQSAVWIAKDVARKLRTLTKPSQTNTLLSPREKEILEHVANGFSNPDIATALDISIKTVQFHLKSIFTKTNTSTRTEAVTVALKEKLIP